MRQPSFALICIGLLLAVVASSCMPVGPSNEFVSTGLAAENPATPTASAIYRALASSIAFIETQTGTGSGLLTEIHGQPYVVTNAHVVWPYSEARVVFPDGEEHRHAPLVQTDQLLDLAVLGPIDSSLQPIVLDDESQVSTGDTVYLIGYPGEGELYPVPAISQGILSRTRTWSGLDSVKFYQTDAAGAGGQSGGVLVSATGDVIGISGMLFADAFVLAVASDGLSTRLARMVADGGVENPRGMMPDRLTRRRHRGELQNLWDTDGFFLHGPYGHEIEIHVESESDVGIALYDSFGQEIGAADRFFEGTEVITATLDTEGPQFLTVEQYAPGASSYVAIGNSAFAAIHDPDDATQVSAGQTISGSIDYPGDIDWFIVTLERGQRIQAVVESVAIDPVLSIGPAGSDIDAYQEDDDSGRGILGGNSRLVYLARRAGEHLVVVRSFTPEEIGGFLLRVEAPK